MKSILLLIKKYFIPIEENNHHPLIIRNLSLFIITSFLLIFNLFFSPYFLRNVKASNINIEGIIELTNQKRLEYGLDTLKRNNLLEKAALLKLENMFQEQYWDHYGPNGETPWKFIKEAGYSYTFAGENLARDFNDINDLINAWMNSPTHRANILNRNYQEIGIAIANGILLGKPTTLIVQLFGTQNYTVLQNIQEYYSKIEDYFPIIKKPKNNTYFNNPKIQIAGESIQGNIANIYVNNNLINTTTINGKNFTTEIFINEGENNIKVQALDYLNNRSSQFSDPVKVFLDTTPIDLQKIDLKIYSYNDKYVLLVDKIEDLKKITLLHTDGTEKILDLYANIFIHQFPKTITNFTLNFYDIADNKISSEYSISEMIIKNQEDIPNFLLGYINETNSDQIGILSILNVSNNNATKLINITILFLLILFILIDGLMLLKKGYLRYNTSHHSINIPMLFLGMFIILFI